MKFTIRYFYMSLIYLFFIHSSCANLPVQKIYVGENQCIVLKQDKMIVNQPCTYHHVLKETHNTTGEIFGNYHFDIKNYGVLRRKSYIFSPVDNTGKPIVEGGARKAVFQHWIEGQPAKQIYRTRTLNHVTEKQLARIQDPDTTLLYCIVALDNSLELCLPPESK